MPWGALTPAIVFLPNNVPCGPRKTSTLSHIHNEVVERPYSGLIDPVDIEADGVLQPDIVGIRKNPLTDSCG